VAGPTPHAPFLLFIRDPSSISFNQTPGPRCPAPAPQSPSPPACSGRAYFAGNVSLHHQRFAPGSRVERQIRFSRRRRKCSPHFTIKSELQESPRPAHGGRPACSPAVSVSATVGWSSIRSARRHPPYSQHHVVDFPARSDSVPAENSCHRRSRPAGNSSHSLGRPVCPATPLNAFFPCWTVKNSSFSLRRGNFLFERFGSPAPQRLQDLHLALPF